jgi:thymidylate synthase (FAD)
MDEIFDEIYQSYLYLLGESNHPCDPLNLRKLAVDEIAMGAVRKLRKENQPDANPDRPPLYPEWANPTQELVDAKINEYYEANELAIIDGDYPGLARELARIVLSLSTYTQFYWKTDLKNLLHFISLRADPHAQYEIRVYAEAMLGMITPLFPWCVQAFLDYDMHAHTFSRMEMETLRYLLGHYILEPGPDEAYKDIQGRLKDKGASKREIIEFMEAIK